MLKADVYPDEGRMGSRNFLHFRVFQSLAVAALRVGESRLHFLGHG